MHLQQHPQYWPRYTSGLVPGAIERLRVGVELTATDVAVMREYFRQWAYAGIWDTNPSKTEGDSRRLAKLRASIDAIKDGEDVRTWIALAKALGMDPL